MRLIGLGAPDPLAEGVLAWCRALGVEVRILGDDLAAMRLRTAGFSVLHLIDRPLRQWQGPLSAPLALEVAAGDWVVHVDRLDEPGRARVQAVLEAMAREQAL